MGDTPNNSIRLRERLISSSKKPHNKPNATVANLEPTSTKLDNGTNEPCSVSQCKYQNFKTD